MVVIIMVMMIIRNSILPGKFKDTVIPKEGTETLHTLAAQAKEHHLRETVADYATLRHKQLKYSSMVRMVC